MLLQTACLLTVQIQEDEMETKSAWTSKVNWAAVATGVLSLLSSLGIGVPDALKETITVIITSAGTLLVIILRTFFTKKLIA